MDELRDIEHALRRHATVVELGCASGRVCTRLLELKLSVTGVDESEAMLAHLPDGVEGICASIYGLGLVERGRRVRYRATWSIIPT